MLQTCRLMPILVTAISLLISFAVGAETKVELPPYQVRDGISGSLKSVGSDTMNNIMTLWQEGFKNNFYPNVLTQVEGKGSSTAPPALTSGTANFAPMSREMKSAEKAEFKEKFGYEPTGLRVGIDMIVLYVHRDNPIESLTLPQVDAIFSKARRTRYPKNLITWGDLGLQGEWKNRTINAFGRNSASGTYGYVKENVLLGGDFKDSVMEQPGSSGVVAAVAKNLGGIGYSGVGYATADVKAISLAYDVESTPVPPKAERAYDGSYPLARFLLVYLNRDPDVALDPLRREFVFWMLSRDGQRAVTHDGCLPIPDSVRKEELARVGLAP